MKTLTQKSNKKRQIKYPGISEDADQLGVTRQHLWEVLEGNRSSKILLKRYKALKAKQGKGGDQ